MKKILIAKNKSIFLDNVKKVEIVCDPYAIWMELYAVVITMGDNEQTETIGTYSSKFKALKAYEEVLNFMKEPEDITYNVLQENDIDDGTMVKINPFDVKWCEEELLDVLSALYEEGDIGTNDFQDFLTYLEEKDFEAMKEIIESWIDEADENDFEELQSTLDDVWGRVETLEKNQL